MGKPVSSNVKRAETTALNTKVNKEVFNNFKDCLAYKGYAMNTILEVFMQQYANGKINIDHEDIIKWKMDDSEVDTLNTTFNKEIYLNFKTTCKGKGYFVKHIIVAFMEKFSNGDYVMEYVEVNKSNRSN